MNEIPTPITRKEQYLAKAAGDNSVAVPDPITREEQYLNAIAQGGGGSSLPDVTSDDNGDVLTVVDGAWAKAAPSGGGGVPYSPIEYDETTGTYTLSQIYSPLYITALEPTSPESADISIDGLAIEGATAVSPILGSVTMRIDGETGDTSYEASMCGTVDIELAGDSIYVQISEDLQDGICNAVLNKIATAWPVYGSNTPASLLRVWLESAPGGGDIYPTMVFPPLAL